MEGFFYIAYTGSTGSGFGVLAFTRGVIAGADVAGSTYAGSYTENRGLLSFSVTMNAPAGVTPVQTGIPLAAPMELQVTGSFSQSDLDGGTPVLVETPLGPVNAILKKISEFPSLPG